MTRPSVQIPRVLASGHTGVLLGLVVIGALGRCAAHATPAATPNDSTDASVPSTPVRDAGPGDASSDASASAADAGDPVVNSAIDDIAERMAASSDGGTSSRGIELALVERGPDVPWVFALVNTTDQTYQVASDPRLLWFEIKVPGKKKATRCGFPSSMIPSEATRSLQVTLRPGEVLTDRFDPRLYCFDSTGQTHLVPGATVEPHFGWHADKHFGYKHGHRVELAPKPPFVASLLTADQVGAPPSLNEPLAEPSAGAADAGAAAPDVKKELVAKSFSLGSQYASWSQSGIGDHTDRPDSGPFELVMKKGSDAYADRTATISVALHNRSKIKQTVYFRRELVSFEVMGPNGRATCDPQPDVRAPDRQAYLTLGPGGTTNLTSRLIELCPQGTFLEPGLYLIHGRFDARQSGASYGLDAFVGQVSSPEPALVRIRTGEQRGLEKRMLRTNLDGGRAAGGEGASRPRTPDAGSGASH